MSFINLEYKIPIKSKFIIYKNNLRFTNPIPQEDWLITICPTDNETIDSYYSLESNCEVLSTRYKYCNMNIFYDLPLFVIKRAVLNDLVFSNLNDRRYIKGFFRLNRVFNYYYSKNNKIYKQKVKVAYHYDK